MQSRMDFKVVAIIAILLITIAVGVSCSKNFSTMAGSSPPAPYPVESTTEMIATRTLDLEPTLVATRLPSETSTATHEAKPASTSVPDGGNTLTNLLRSNGDCLLPCWWGIMPGETSWTSAEALLKPLSSRIVPFNQGSYVVYFAYHDTTQNDPAGLLSSLFAVREQTVQLLSSNGKTGGSYVPSQILTEYGPPDQVWLQTANSSRDGHLGFLMTLFYGKLGFLLRYGSEGVVDGTDIASCISNHGTSLRLVAWSSELDLDYREAMAIGSSSSIVTDDLDLETATGLSLEQFYKAFREEGSEVCLRTPQVLWPNP